MLGITGAALQASVLGPLAETYMSGNEIAKQAAGTVWATISQGSQNGLWPMEGPTIGFWAIVNGLLFEKNKSVLGFPLGSGWLGICWICCASFSQAFLKRLYSLELFLLPVQVVWLGIFGLSLLQR